MSSLIDLKDKRYESLHVKDLVKMQYIKKNNLIRSAVRHNLVSFSATNHPVPAECITELFGLNFLTIIVCGNYDQTPFFHY